MFEPVLLLSALATLLWAPRAHGDANDAFRSLTRDFVQEYETLDIPALQLSYVDNFDHIQDNSGIQRQSTFFKRISAKLGTIRRTALTDALKMQYDVLQFEIKQNKERLHLEKIFRETGASVSPKGLYSTPGGRDWYAYFVRRWTSSSITPSALFQLGSNEVKKVRSRMEAIQRDLGYAGRDIEFYALLNEPRFLLTDESELMRAFSEVRDRIEAHLSTEFEPATVPVVAILPIPNPTKDSPPGYYSDNVFYFNFFGQKLQKRNLDWLFIHEANPGHHYQTSIALNVPTPSPFGRHFWYPGFSEGWGAYTENLGAALGLYRDRFQELGKWEWDIVRSARLVLDVGLNYYGWSKDQALAYWKANIPNQDAIAAREIDRMMRWPAQVNSYKVGEARFLKLRDMCLAQKEPCDIRKFHTQVLRHGTLPLDVLERSVVGAISNGALSLTDQLK